MPPSTVRATDPATFLLNRAHDVTTPLGVLMDSDLATCAVTAVDASERTLTLAVTLSDGIFTLHPSNKEGPNLLQCVFDVLQYWEDEDLLKASEHTRPASAERHPQHHGNGATSNPSDAADAPWSREHMRDSIFKAMLPGDWHFEEPEPPGLQCRLFKYQRRALAWMLWREGLQADGSSTYARCADEGSVKARLPTHADVWPSVKVGSRIVSYNQLVRGLSDGTCPPPPPVPSGILADEMGLGKTVEMIALILARRRAGGGRAQPGSSNGTLAGADGAGVEGGTLVVCPPALVQQWRSELNNHAGASLNVVVYSGLRETREAEEEAQRHAEEDANGGRKRRRKNADEANVLMRLRKMNSHVTLDMVREAEFYARMAAGEDPPVDDADAYARDIARTLAAADVVLTSFDVLSKEVHYDSEKNLRPLRHAKRYKVPDCPLVLVDWHRLVVDEAQMVARFSAVSEMGGKLRAAHRWCVTGTPMTSQYEADDLHALLKFVRHEPFQWQGAWDWLIGRRLAGGYDTYDPITARKGWDTLIKTLQPLMWRTDKETVHAEFHLPPRELHVAQLALQPGEHELYEKLVQAARDTHAKVVTAEVEVAAATAGVPSGREGPAATSARSKKRLAKLQENEVDDLTQLRLACIHPQLTRFWTKDLASELQLASGGAASMNEILRQLVHKEEVELQEAERLLCANLNTLAMALMPTREVLEAGANGNNGEPGSPKGTADGTNNGGAASQQVDDGAGPSSPTAGAGDGSGHTPGKKRRTNSQLPPKEALALAIELLEDSFRVSEKGISALGVDLDKLEEMRDPMQVLATSWAAWKKVQINTGWQLVVAYELAGRSGAPLQKMRTKVAKWTGELEEQVSQELHAAALAEEDHRKKVETTGARVVAAAQKALEGGFPPVWGFTDIADPEGVLDRLHDEYRQAQGVESEQMAGKNGILGKHVHHVLMEVEKKVQADQNALEGWVAAQQAAVARAQLQSALAAVDGTC